MEMETGDRGRWDDLIWCVRCVILGCVFGVPSAFAHITQMKDRERRNLHRLAEAAYCSVCCVCGRMYMCVYIMCCDCTYIYVHMYILYMPSVGTSHLPHCWWCSSPSEVELALETTFERDKQWFQYADVTHDGGVDNKEFIYFLHPEYNKEAVRGEGRGSEFECVCVCVCVCVPMVAHTLWRQPFVAITRIPTPTPPPQMMSLAEDLIKRLHSNHDQTLCEEEFLTYYSKKMEHVYTRNEVQQTTVLRLYQ